MHPYERLLRDTYAAFNARNLPATQKALGPNVEWPDAMEGGSLHGPEAVGEYWKRRWDLFDPHFDLRHFEIDAAGRVVITLVQTLRGANGVTISKGLIRHVHEFENGLVRRMTVLY